MGEGRDPILVRSAPSLARPNSSSMSIGASIRGRKLTVVSSAEPGSPTEMVSSNTKSSIGAQRKSSLLRARLSSRNAQGLLQLLQAMPASKKKLLSPSFQNWYLLKLQLH